MKNYFFLILFLTLIGCQETIEIDLTTTSENSGSTTTIVIANEPINIRAQKDKVSEVTQSTATIIGEFTQLDDNIIITEHGHCWSSSSDSPTRSDCEGYSELGGVDNIGVFTTTIRDLPSNTTYYVRAYIITDEGKIHYLKTVTMFKTA